MCSQKQVDFHSVEIKELDNLLQYKIKSRILGPKLKTVFNTVKIMLKHYVLEEIFHRYDIFRENISGTIPQNLALIFLRVFITNPTTHVIFHNVSCSSSRQLNFLWNSSGFLRETHTTLNHT